MKNKLIWLGIGALLLIGYTVSVCAVVRASIKPPPPVVITEPETTWVVKWKDPQCIYDTIYDTFFVNPTTPIGSIPLQTKIIKDSIPVIVSKQKQYQYIRFVESIDYRGILYGYSIKTIPEPFTINNPKQPKPFPIRPFVWVNADYLLATVSSTNRIRVSSEIGLSFWSRVDLHLVAEWESQIKGGAGVRYWLLR